MMGWAHPPGLELLELCVQAQRRWLSGNLLRELFMLPFLSDSGASGPGGRGAGTGEDFLSALQCVDCAGAELVSLSRAGARMMP